VGLPLPIGWQGFAVPVTKGNASTAETLSLKLWRAFVRPATMVVASNVATLSLKSPSVYAEVAPIAFRENGSEWRMASSEW
jgi:hypothetical protein